jgi:hypothetical protein
LSDPGGDFYDLTSPAYPQQGDIFPNVPLISPPAGRYVVILRETDGRPWLPRPGILQAMDEQVVNAFDRGPEYVAVSAERGLAAVLTQTCDLDQDQWLVCPLTTIEGTNIDPGNLFAGKYANLFGIPKHPYGYFETGCLFLPQCFTIRRESVQLGDRIASLSLSAQHALTDKLSETLTRLWGFSPGEPVRETGKYRCLRCFQFYDVKCDIVEFQAGQKFGDCSGCSKIGKKAQWRLLRKHRKY